MIGLQIIGATVVLVALYMSYFHFKRSELNKLEFCIWAVIWLAFLVMIIAPTFFSFVIKPFNIDQKFELFVSLALIVIYLIVLKISISNQKMHQRLESLIREDALGNLETRSQKK